MASEEDDQPIPVPANVPAGKYVFLYDPLDGSSNIDVNVSIGTIFAIHRRVTASGPGKLADCLQAGTKQIAAGYILYGSSTMLVYTTGNGVHGFTLDPTIGEFLLSHPHIRIPEVGRYYSVNESNWNRWSAGKASNSSTRSWAAWSPRSTSRRSRPASRRPWIRAS